MKKSLSMSKTSTSASSTIAKIAPQKTQRVTGYTSTNGLRLSYTSPVVAVFLRILAWEHYVAKRQLSVGHVVTQQLQTARRDLGLAPNAARSTSGAADDLVQRLRTQNLLSPKNTDPVPTESGWADAWRLHYLPPHNLVRQLSFLPMTIDHSPQGSPQGFCEYVMTLRDPAIPRLRLAAGTLSQVATTCANRRGVYFLRLPETLYVGKSDEIDVRLGQHIKKKNPLWCVFLSLEDDGSSFSLDALGATEGLLISFWNEVCDIANGNRGSDRKPAPMYLQQAVLFATGASAALLWLVRLQIATGLTGWELPFKRWNDASKSWPGCYLKDPRGGN